MNKYFTASENETAEKILDIINFKFGTPKKRIFPSWYIKSFNGSIYINYIKDSDFEYYLFSEDLRIIIKKNILHQIIKGNKNKYYFILLAPFNETVYNLCGLEIHFNFFFFPFLRKQKRGNGS